MDANAVAARKVIAGLGNPGKQYERTRHNVGFMAAELLARRHGLKFDKMMSKGLVALGEIGNVKVALVKPQTFMNVSGECVGPIMKFYKSLPDDLVVMYDELDIPFAQVRMKPSGGAGGHNGMKSIIQRISSQEFARIRLGIGRPPGRMDPAAFVLQPFATAEQIDVEEMIARAADAVEIWLREGVAIAMNRTNVS
jgi:peptidyl-tRNA hydrolase, PTH1 family